jgi:hypothetical protein
MRCATNSFVVAFRPWLVPQRLKPARGDYQAWLRHDSRWKSSGQVPSCPFTSRGPTIEARARPGVPWTCPDAIQSGCASRRAAELQNNSALPCYLLAIPFQRPIRNRAKR